MADNVILEVNGLSSWYGRGRERKQVLKNVSLTLREGEVLGIVGESGSGKSTLIKCILGMVPETQGRVTLHVQWPQMVFQDPYSALNPVKTVGWILEEPLRAIGVRDKQARRQRALEMMRLVGLDETLYSRRPAQLSGGQRQRAAIAAALIQGSKLIALDEPVSALDVTLQAQILELLTELKETLGLSYLFISHDLSVVYQICDRVAVLYQGEIVEQGDVDAIYDHPRHPYTRKLLADSMDLDE